MNVITKKCLEDGCSKIPSYNYANETKGIYCATHKEENMVNIRSKKPIIQPNMIDVTHKRQKIQPNMIDVTHKRQKKQPNI